MGQLPAIVIIWSIVAIILIALEFVIPGAILGFLGMAAFIVAGLLHFKIVNGLVFSLIYWFIISIFLILFLRSFVLKFMPGDYEVQDTDEDEDLKGHIVEVLEEVRPESNGRVRYRDTTWQAQSNSRALEPGEKAVIESRSGNVLTIRPLD